MESILPLIIQAVSGLVGGNGVGAAARGLSLGGAGNSIVGAIGGLVGGQVLGGPIGSMLGGATEAATDAAASGAMDGIIGQIASGGIGGGVLMAVVGIIKKMMSGNG